MIPGQGLVPEQTDETQTDAARRGSEGAAAGGSGQQELSPREQVETGDRSSAPRRPAAERSAAAVAAVPASAPHAEAHKRLG